MIRVTADTTNAEALLKAVQRQVPFATSKAINRVATTFQDVKRRDFRRDFTLRRQAFIEREGVKVLGGFATKARLHITVGVNPERAGFLAKFEKGTPKIPSGQHLAIPNAQALDRSRVIPRNMRPRNLEIAEGRAQAIRINKRKGTVKAGKVRGAMKGLQRTYLVPEVGIFQRRGRGKGSTTRLLYGFETRAKTPPDLRFKARAQEIMQRKFPEYYKQEFVSALRTARVKP